MIPKSIKWRLQLWYGLMLMTVLAGLGIAAFQLQRGKMYRQVDDELLRRINIVANVLRASGLRRPPPETGFGRPPGDLPEGGPPGRGLRRALQNFHLPARDVALFDASDPNGFYFIVIARDGRELARSTNAPAGSPYSFSSGKILPPSPPPKSPDNSPAEADGGFHPDRGGGRPRATIGQPEPPVMHGTCREIEIQMPPGERIVVGRNIKPELAELHLAGLKLAGIGGVILFFGLAGGWLLTNRAIRPIAEISGTAAKISAGDLSQRINTDETESELGQLAAVLNSTFARLETAFAQQKQFASDAAHELRTPVSVMLTQTQTALNRERDAASYKQTVEACQRAAQRMRRLIESLLELTRFDTGQEVLNRVRFDFTKAISDGVELVKPLADERCVKMISELAQLEITGDSERLAQVVVNLLTNAIQYNRPDGEVRVKLEVEGGLAVLTISDTGQGITPADLPHVFKRFYRADQARTGSGNAGLGLSICKAIVEAHGGTIEVASEENTGTNFIVRLPA